MGLERTLDNAKTEGAGQEKLAAWFVHLVQLLFLAIMLFELDAPFLSAHNERQNQTFDMARHVFHDGWRSVTTPKVSYCIPGYEKESVTAVLQEVPFHGLLGWPLTLVTSHERAVVRLVSTAFALFSIQLMFWILRFWLPPAASAAGAVIWAMSPLVLHFGQVPMPDIVCTTGMLAAFWFALRGRLVMSSGWFAFAILAKTSVMVFGLPTLVALLCARNCWSVKDSLRLAVVWGWFPLLALLGWLGILYYFAPPTPMSMANIMATRGHWSSLVSPGFYKFVLGCLLPFGVGVLGFGGLIFAARAGQQRMDARIKWAIVVSNLVFLVFVIRKVPEPQYLVPVLPWCVMAAGFGLQILLEKQGTSFFWRSAVGVTLVLHIFVALFFTIDLKTSRIPNFPAIEQAAGLLPPEARVVVIYRYYGASPAIWLSRNVTPMGVPDRLSEEFSRLQRLGFTHVLILDTESLHDSPSAGGPRALLGRIVQAFRKTPPAPKATMSDFTDPSGLFRQFCDRNFSQKFSAPHVMLYSMTASQPAQTSEPPTAIQAGNHIPASNP